MLPNWAWGVLVIVLAILYPYIIEQLISSSDDLLDASIRRSPT